MSPTLPPRLRVQSDARLLQLTRRGEAGAFEALVRRHRRGLLGHCRRLGVSEVQAEDALQQGLLHAWHALRRGDEVREVRSWLYRIVHNAALDALRRPGRDAIALDERLHVQATPSAARELDRRLAAHAALMGLAGLPAMQREALLRTAVHGDSHEQVASAMGLSRAAVRGLVHRARLAMRATAGALVPEGAIQWLLRLGFGSSTPELGTGSAGTGGTLATLAKGGAVLATGGALAAGIAVTRHGDTHRGGPHAAHAAHAARTITAGGVSATIAQDGAAGAAHGALLASLSSPTGVTLATRAAPLRPTEVDPWHGRPPEQSTGRERLGLARSIQPALKEISPSTQTAPVAPVESGDGPGPRWGRDRGSLSPPASRQGRAGARPGAGTQTGAGAQGHTTSGDARRRGTQPDRGMQLSLGLSDGGGGGQHRGASRTGQSHADWSDSGESHTDRSRSNADHSREGQLATAASPGAKVVGGFAALQPTPDVRGETQSYGGSDASSAPGRQNGTDISRGAEQDARRDEGSSPASPGGDAGSQ